MRTRILIVLVTIITVGIGVRVTLGLYHKHKLDIAIDQLVTLIPIPSRDDPQGVFDAVRAFVNDNSTYAEYEEPATSHAGR